MSLTQRILNISRRYGGASAGGPPVGAIAIWTGTLASIPANWNLCDGTGVTPNLVARFLRGAPAATNPGTTGGADSHTHASMTAAGSHTHTAGNRTHSHTVVSAGGHNHAGDIAQCSPGSAGVWGVTTVGAHQHTTNVDAGHTHTMDTYANHTHPISSDDGRPPYYEVAFIRAAAGAAVAANLAIIWTGTLVAIPAGWALCDGVGGRPDLRTRFVRGVNTAITNPGTTGGATTHGHTETAGGVHSHVMNAGGSHTHTFNAYTWTHTHNVTIDTPEAGAVLWQNDTGAGNHTHAVSNDPGTHTHNAMGNDGSHSHTVVAASSLPVYYDVAYIINTGGATIIPTNGILIWTGLLVNIPVGYSQCDGAGGRPELRGYFSRGASAGVDPGGTGGANTHTHTDQNAGAHSAHSLTSAGAHQHTATDSIGGHLHAETGTLFVGAGQNVLWKNQASAGAHSHTYNIEDNHINHVLTDPGNHTHNVWSTDEGRPAYYEVAYILKA